MTEEEIFHNYFKCPSCFYLWREASNRGIESRIEKLCSWCEENKPSSLQLLHRQVDILSHCGASDFPKVFKHLFDHIHLH